MSRVGNHWSTRHLASLSYLVESSVNVAVCWDQSLFLCNYDGGSGDREGRLDSRDISETELTKFGDQLDVMGGVAPLELGRPWGRLWDL